MKLVILAALIKCYNLKAKQYINNYREYMYMTIHSYVHGFGLRLTNAIVQRLKISGHG